MTAAPVRPTVEQLLAFEAAHPPHRSKEETIRAVLQITPARYFQLLHRALDTDEAVRIDPMLTNRLRRLRDEREARRTARTTITR